MSNRHKSFLEKKWVADKIEKRFYNSEIGPFIDYEISDFEDDKNAPSHYEQMVIISKMEKTHHAIKIHERKFDKNLSKNPKFHRENLLKIEIIPSKFDDYLTWLKEQGEIVGANKIEIEIKIGKLSSHSDGSISYGGKRLDMRNQLKDLCRLFMKNQRELLTIDFIKDWLIRADKRPLTPNITIAKYVSELHKILMIHFGRRVIFNQEEEGWRFEP